MSEPDDQRTKDNTIRMESATKTVAIEVKPFHPALSDLVLTDLKTIREGLDAMIDQLQTVVDKAYETGRLEPAPVVSLDAYRLRKKQGVERSVTIGDTPTPPSS